MKLQMEDDLLQLAVFATEIKIKGKDLILVTINNIQNVLDEKETEAWQKLIRVLTHEIMNSITPIASLSGTIDMMLRYIEQGSNASPTDILLSREDLDEMKQAMLTINKRSTGLLHFVNTYRNLTKIPKPNFQLTPIHILFRNTTNILAKELEDNHIKIKISVTPQHLELSMDEELMEQVLINLVKNSIFALTNKQEKSIELNAFYNKRGRVTIQVYDNGSGIMKEVQDKIFIPFFTTKSTGSGIGLSLSKQIIRLHNASISVHSMPDQETTFTITF